MAKNNQKKQQSKEAPKPSAFETAVKETEEVKNGFRSGKQAIKNSDRDKVSAAEDRKIQGSLDIDTQVKKLYPNDPRWDYVISYNNILYFFEVHPAETSQIDNMIRKVQWLRNWLKTKASSIDAITKAEYPYIWVQSGRYAILPTAKEQMKLSVAGITTKKILSLK